MAKEIIDNPDKLPHFVVLRMQDGVVHGLTEESFGLGTSTSRVRLWWSGKAYSMLGEHLISGEEDAKHNARPGDAVFDLADPDCPIEVDVVAWKHAEGKYAKRNPPFKLRPLGQYVVATKAFELEVARYKASIEALQKEAAKLAKVIDALKEEDE